jgi:hypothetical protein
MKLKYGILILGSFCLLNANAQVTINTNSIIHARGTLSTNAVISNKSARTNLSDAQLILSGADQNAATDQSITLSTLKVTEGGTKTLSGNWEITNSLQLVNGVLKINDNSRLLYSGQTLAEGNEFSFIEGFFFQRGPGRKYFPIGVGSTYAPLVLEDFPSGSAETGIRVVSNDAQFILPDQVSLGASHYWEMTSAVASPVSLSLNGVTELGANTELVILQSGSINGAALPFEGAQIGSFLTSTETISQPFLAVGRKGEFQLVIHDMITPFIRDNINDNLFIENIERTKSNSVKLFDRWGGLVETWTDYKNATVYDFSLLSPGNYVCVVDFVFPGDNRSNTAKGMITILKTK